MTSLKRTATKKPQEGSREWEEGLRDDPQYAQNILPMLIEHAARGDKDAASTMAWILDRHPHLRSTVRQLDDLTDGLLIAAAGIRFGRGSGRTG